MTATPDESLKLLEAFCERLRAVNPVVDAAVADLDRVGHGLGECESRLSLELDHLAGDVEGLQKEAESTEAAAVRACGELGQAAEEAKAPVLAELETNALDAQGHWTQTFQEKAAALAKGFEEMKSSGWEPLDAALETGRSYFEMWTQAADTALAGLVGGMGSVATDVDQEGGEAQAAAQGLGRTAPATDPFWEMVTTEGHRVSNETAQGFDDSMAQQSGELITVYEELVAAIGEGSAQVRGQLDLTLQKASDAVDALAVEIGDALEKTLRALEKAELEFERSAVQAERAEAAGQGAVELAAQVVEAKTKLRVIEEVTEALGQ